MAPCKWSVTCSRWIFSFSLTRMSFSPWISFFRTCGHDFLPSFSENSDILVNWVFDLELFWHFNLNLILSLILVVWVFDLILFWNFNSNLILSLQPLKHRHNPIFLFLLVLLTTSKSQKPLKQRFCGLFFQAFSKKWKSGHGNSSWV